MPPEAEIVSAIGRALTLQQRGQLGGARALLEGLLERAPDHPDALHFLGLVLHQQGEFEALPFLVPAVRQSAGLSDLYPPAKLNRLPE